MGPFVATHIEVHLFSVFQANWNYIIRFPFGSLEIQFEAKWIILSYPFNDLSGAVEDQWNVTLFMIWWKKPLTYVGSIFRQRLGKSRVKQNTISLWTTMELFWNYEQLLWNLNNYSQISWNHSSKVSKTLEELNLRKGRNVNMYSLNFSVNFPGDKFHLVTFKGVIVGGYELRR